MEIFLFRREVITTAHPVFLFLHLFQVEDLTWAWDVAQVATCRMPCMCDAPSWPSAQGPQRSVPAAMVGANPQHSHDNNKRMSRAPTPQTQLKCPLKSLVYSSKGFPRFHSTRLGIVALSETILKYLFQTACLGTAGLQMDSPVSRTLEESSWPPPALGSGSHTAWCQRGFSKPKWRIEQLAEDLLSCPNNTTWYRK